MISLFVYILYIDIYVFDVPYFWRDVLPFLMYKFFFWLMYNDLARDKKKKKGWVLGWKFIILCSKNTIFTNLVNAG